VQEIYYTTVVQQQGIENKADQLKYAVQNLDSSEGAGVCLSAGASDCQPGRERI
jgi:hypothetical protein